MELNFPNPSRYYEENEHGVHFWGYYRTIEILFFIEESTFFKIDPETKSNEAGFLNTFDSNTEKIHLAANTAYSQRKKSSRAASYRLTESDF